MSTQSLILFASGFGPGAVATALYYESSRDGGYNFGPNNNVAGIDLARAYELRNNYKETYPWDSIEGYNISMQQLGGIDSTIRRTLNSDLSKISGFRLYKALAAKDPKATKSFIVYPIGSDFRMQSPEKVFNVSGFDDKYVLPCPRFCD